MKKISIPACICACVLTWLLTLSGVFFCHRLFSRIAAARAPYTAGDKLAEAAEIIRENFIGEYEESALTDDAIDAMVASLGDRWSYYMTADEVEDYARLTANSYGGIGIVIRGETGERPDVLKVYAQSPAGEAGVLPGSSFLAVNGQDVSGMDRDGISELIRAAIAEGRVDLRLSCPDGEARDYSLTPGEVYTDPVSYGLTPAGLGYIRLENFEGRSAQQAIDAVEDLRARAVPGIIFDVRENPGGQLSELLKLLDYLLPEGKLFISRNMDGSEHVDYSEASYVELPMAVLLNEDSYSAAEFFAAALREYGWAELVGAQTSGKGYAQITVPMTDGSAIHISHIAYFTPNGVCLAGVGLTPDHSVALGEEERSLLYYGMLPPEDDAQLAAAERLLLGSAAVSP
jgi:carboxyl-terminal processing protease